MAEALGAISAVVGIGTFLVQIGRGIKNVRKAINYNRYQASEDLLSLEADLNSLHKVIEALSGFQDDPLVILAIARCQQSFVEMELDLDRLTQTIASDQSRTSRLKAMMKPMTLKTEEAVKNMRTKVGLIVQTLIPTSTRITQLELIQAEKISLNSPVTAEASTPSEPALACSGSISSASEIIVAAQRRRAFVRLVDTCYHKKTTYAHGRFWWLELTSTPGFWHTCSLRCPTRCEWNARLRLALTWLNIPFAVTASFSITSRNGQYALQPALSIQHVVNYTSPGFLALWFCQIHEISLEESKQRLRDLYRTDQHFRYHVNPEGKGYLRHLVSRVWNDQDLQFELLDFLITEIGLDFSAEEPRFLIECSKWIGEGRHLYLLDRVLEHGFAPNGIDAPAADQWPEPCNPDWMSEMTTPDPFYLNYLTKMVKSESGFNGVTELQKHILTDTFHTLLDADGDLPNKKQLFSMVNFLGQSSLHLAVRNIRTVKKLVELDHDLNATDRWGTTPLMYAASMGFQDVTIYLLERGALAKPGLRETRFCRTFFDFAIVRGHWSLIHRALSTIKDIAPEEIHQVFAEHVVCEAMTSDFSIVGFDPSIRRQHIPLVIQQCGNVNFTFGDHQYNVTGNNLMYYIRSIEEAEALVARGFNLFNTPNSVGRLPIHSLTFDPALVRFCVEHGTSIDHVDANGQTLLLVLLSRLGGFSLRDHDRIKKLESIRCCLDLGADPHHSDDCRCPCSPGGCSSSASFETGFDCTWFTSIGASTDVFWIFEWQSIVQDLHGDEAVKEFLLSFIRRIEFDELGMTHVCCHGGSGIPVERIAPWIGTSWPKKIDEEDLCDILDEEEEFVDILEQTMRELALRTVNELRTYLLEILKERYDRHLQQNAEKRAKSLWRTKRKVNSGVKWHVDYKKDTYWQQLPYFDCSAPVDYSILRDLADYIVYIDLIYSLMHDSASQGSQKDALYSRRMCLVKEITEVFGLSNVGVVGHIDEAIATGRLGIDANAGKRIKHRFILFLHAPEPTTDQNLEAAVRA